MRLIDTETLELKEFFGDRIPEYAILSHTWGDDEATYQDWQDITERSSKAGTRKIYNACQETKQRSIKYLWVDTNCINKESSSELTEAINSMFAWYQGARICFVYLEDYHHREHHGSDTPDSKFEESRWFTRGWTLQELLGPKVVEFFDASWTNFGSKQSLIEMIARRTLIQIDYLKDSDSILNASISRRMSWASTRSTTREEDMAYCLLGLFEVNIPLLYGEGPKAFIRLQEEIVKHSNDCSIFCWGWPQNTAPSRSLLIWNGCLAPEPSAFKDSGDFYASPSGQLLPKDFQITNNGLRITLPLLYSTGDTTIALLGVKNRSLDASPKLRACLVLERSLQTWMRVAYGHSIVYLPFSWFNTPVPIYLAHERNPSRIESVEYFPVSSSLLAVALHM